MADPARSGRRGWVRALGPGAGDSGRRRIARAAGCGCGSRKATATRPRARGEDCSTGSPCRCRHSPQMIEGAGLDAAADACPAAARWSRGSATQPHYIVADPDLFNNHGLAIPAGARGAGADRRAQPAEARTASPSISPSTASARGPAEPAAHRLRAALPGDDPGPGRRRLARRAARRVPLRPGAARGARDRVRQGGPGREQRRPDPARQARGAARRALMPRSSARTRRAPPARRLACSGEALDAYLDRLSTATARSFSELAARLAAARDRHELVAAARALFSWKKDIIR